MNDNIYMDLPAVDIKIAKLKEERETMRKALEFIKNEILKMPNVWNGNTGDKNYEILIKYSVNFNEILKKIDEFIDTLQKSRDAYEKLDNDTIDRMEENAGIGATE